MPRWKLIGSARWSGGYLIDGGVWHGTGIGLGRTKAESEALLRAGVDSKSRPLPSRGLQLVESPAGVSYVWDPTTQTIRRP